MRVLKTFAALLIFLLTASAPSDPMAVALVHQRWTCTGGGCLRTADIWRMTREIRRQANRHGLDPKLLAGLVMVENPWLDSTAVSRVGAWGLTQIMPVHFGQWPGCGPEPGTIEQQICYGASILSFYLRLEERRAEHRALLRYNGCWVEDCKSYAAAVREAAGRLE